MKGKPGKRATVFLALGNAVSNGGVCIYFGFLVMYLSQYGYTESWIGLVMMLCALANMVSQPLIGYLTDTYVPNKQMLIILAAASIPSGKRIDSGCCGVLYYSSFHYRTNLWTAI